MPTKNEKIDFLTDVMRQARVRECIGKECEECKFYDCPHCLEACYATELIDLGIVQLPVEKQNKPEAETKTKTKTVAPKVDPIEFKQLSDELHSGIVKILTNYLEPYIAQRLNTFANTIKRQSQSFFIADGNGQYHDEPYVSVTVIDHVLSLFSGVDSE